MKFPLIFTDYDKRRALALRNSHPELSDDEIISRVVRDIQKEVDSGENRPFKERSERINGSKSAKKATRSKAKRKRSVKILYTGGFESNRRRH